MTRLPAPLAHRRWLGGLLFLAVAMPAVAFAWGRGANSHLAFVLYREPKLIAASILGWLFVAVFVCVQRSVFSLQALQESLTRPALIALAAFLSYMALTGLWVRVPQNYFYEQNQYLLLIALLITLLIWSRYDSAVTRRVRDGLVISMAVVTLVGALQTIFAIPLLTPIDPQIGAIHPSFMGYKNPAALAVLGQIFLLAELAADRRRRATRRWGWGFLFAAELIYLASLGSRTAYVALAVAFLFLLSLLFWRLHGETGGIFGPPTLHILAWLGLALLLAMTWFGLHENSRQRVSTLAPYVLNPSSYLNSDRGTYLRNTLVMVRHHPLGAGLGDWQTHYPVFRQYNRTLSFNDTHQVRRAHSDHVQFLGEGGWPGLVLWFAFLAILILKTRRNYLRSGNLRYLFVASQLVAMVVAMATDYLVEMPYHKLQFFLVVFLAIAPSDTAERKRTKQVGAQRQSRPVQLGLITCVVALAGVQIVYHVGLARKIHAAASLEEAYFPARDDPRKRPDLLARGQAFAMLWGHTKSFHNDYLLLAQSAHWLGQKQLAFAAAKRSLELHPYSTHAFRLMAEMSVDADQAAPWNEAYVHVMDEATTGYDQIYPVWPEP